jgi:hypothetical protein
MFLIPLNQPESVQLVIHALLVAGGVADCSSCPVRKVCMKQCLKIAESLQVMIDDGSLPSLVSDEEDTPELFASSIAPEAGKPAPEPGKTNHLTIIK